MTRIDVERLKESFDRHRASPDVSIEEYVRSRQISLAQSVMQKKRVYLDKNFWILMRDAAMGRSSSGLAPRLLAALRHGVAGGEIICPVSESLFIELMKQVDAETRRATAHLIDELSTGVSLISQDRRVATEVAHFIYSLAGRSVHPIEHLVWTKLSYVLGEQHPVSPAFDASEMLVIQKAFVDQMWGCSLVEIVDRLGNTQPPINDYEHVAERLNVESARHAGVLRSFTQTYKSEIRGSLTLAMPVARQVLERLADRGTGLLAQTPAKHQGAHERQLLDYFCDAVTAKEVAVALRTLHIGALCHAAVRWDKKRKLTGNDLFDFHHAEAAIGYCDFFFTDAPLQTMLQQRHMKLDGYFSCQVMSSLEEATTVFAA